VLSIGFAFVPAGLVVLFDSPVPLLRAPETYIILNASAVAVVVVDAVGNRQRWARSIHLPRYLQSASSYLASAVSFMGIASLCFTFWAILTALAITPLRVVVTLSPPLSTPGIHTLQDLDLVIALMATAVSLLLLVVVGVLAGGGSLGRVEQPELLLAPLRSLPLLVVDEVGLSLRLVLSPLVWLIPASYIVSEEYPAPKALAGDGLWALHRQR